MADIPVFKRLKPIPVHASHRGGRSVYAPENTMYGYRKSVFEDKTQVLEFDLQLSKDGHLVLMHDTNVNTTTNGIGSLSSFTLDELRKFDAAYYYTPDNQSYPLRGKGHTIPTLNEVLDEFTKVDNLVFFFDLKDINAVTPSLQVIKERKLEDRVILGAVHHNINSKLLGEKPGNIPLAPDFETMMGLWTAFMAGQIATVPIKHEIVGLIVDSRTQSMLIPQLFEAFHARGKWIAVFGEFLDDPVWQKKLIQLKTDIIFCDRPDVLRKTLQSL